MWLQSRLSFDFYKVGKLVLHCWYW